MLAKDLKFSERTKTQSRLILSGLTCCWVSVDWLKEDPCSACWLLQSQCATVNPPLGCTGYLMKEVGALFHTIRFWIPLSGSGAWRAATAALSPQTPHGIRTVISHIHGSMFQSWDFLHFFVWFWVFFLKSLQYNCKFLFLSWNNMIRVFKRADVLICCSSAYTRPTKFLYKKNQYVQRCRKWYRHQWDRTKSYS